jgi:hypothetical protein
MTVKTLCSVALMWALVSVSLAQQDVSLGCADRRQGDDGDCRQRVAPGRRLPRWPRWLTADHHRRKDGDHSGFDAVRRQWKGDHQSR